MPPKKFPVQSNTITGFLKRPRGRPRNQPFSTLLRPDADPSHLDKEAAAPAAATVLTGEGAEAAAAMQDANHGLVNFQLVPKVGASCQ